MTSRTIPKFQKQLTATTFWEICTHVQAATPSWRWGQTAFNTLWELRPEMAEFIRGSSIDPFYASSQSLEMGKFWAWLDNNWDATTWETP